MSWTKFLGLLYLVILTALLEFYTSLRTCRLMCTKISNLGLCRYSDRQAVKQPYRQTQTESQTVIQSDSQKVRKAGHLIREPGLVYTEKNVIPLICSPPISRGFISMSNRGNIHYTIPTQTMVVYISPN